MNKRSTNTLKKNKSQWAIFSLINNTKLNKKQVLGWRIVAGKKITSELYIRVIRKFRNEFVVRGVNDKEKETLNNLVASSGSVNFFLSEDMVLFQSDVKHVDTNGDFVFKMPEMIAQIDRRKHMRLFLDSAVEARCVFCKENHGHRVVNQQFQKDCFDISAGGLSFFVSRAENKFFEVEDKIKNLKINIENEWVKVSGRVVNIYDVEPDSRNKLHYKARKVCVRYYEIHPSVSKKIDQFVFKHVDIDEAV